MTNRKCLQLLLKTKMKKPLPLSKFVFGSFCKLELSSSKRHELSKSKEEEKKKQMLTVQSSYFLLALIETMRTASVQISFVCVLQVNYITKKILFRSPFLSVFIDMHIHTTWERVLESSQNITK